MIQTYKMYKLSQVSFNAKSLLLSNRLSKNFETLSLDNFKSYVQGQSPEPRIREYFYYIDHHGMLFLDDARIKNFTSCFKDKKFLQFFFKRLRKNFTNRYNENFPYLSLCGRERNYVRCDDLPVVFTHVIKKQINNNDNNNKSDNNNFAHLLSYANADDLLTVPFQPDKIFMSMKTCRVYHPGPEATGGIGLLSSKLSIEFSKYFEFLNGEYQCPTNFHWENINYELNKDWYRDLIN